MVILVCCLPNGANASLAPLLLGWAWEVPGFMATVIFLCGSKPTASQREERNPQGWVLDEEVLKAMRASWITVNVVGTCWSFALSSC